MKFKTSREFLIKPLQVVYGAVERRQTLPILGNLLLVVQGDRMALTGTDQEVEITGHGAVQEGEDGEITVPARKLMEICRNLPDAAIIEARLDERRLSLVSGRFRSHLATLPAADFPSVEMASGYRELRLASREFKRLLDATAFAMAQQDVRYFFNGMLLEVTAERMRSVATNGQRLALCDLSCATGIEGPIQVIIPRKGVAELLRMLKEDDTELTLQLSANHLRALTAEATLTTKLIDGAYPDYTRAIPSKSDRLVTVDRLELREALTRTAILSNEMYRNVRLGLDGNTLRLHANNPQQEEAEEVVSMGFSGAPLEIAFNVEYLLDALGAIAGDQVTIALAGANHPALLRENADSEALYVVSPMML